MPARLHRATIIHDTLAIAARAHSDGGRTREIDAMR